MSTLAAARADNFYLSKNYDPGKVKPKKSDLAEQKPFKVVEGQRVGGNKVRYETPFHVRCQGCENMVAKGVRFNAIKTWVDNFHSTKIYEFRMKCPQCIQRFIVRTDPQNCDYLYIKGAKRIFQAKDCTDETRIRDQQKQEKIKQNPFSKLENAYHDKEVYGNTVENLCKLQEIQQRGNNDFELNRQLRKKVRVLKQDEQQDCKQRIQKNIFIPLLPYEKQDEIQSGKITFKNYKVKKIKKQETNIRDKIKQKLKKLHPNIKKKLKLQMKNMNQIHSFNHNRHITK